MTFLNKFTDNNIAKHTIVISILTSLLLLSSCASTYKKSKPAAIEQTNKQEKLPTKTSAIKKTVTKEPTITKKNNSNIVKPSASQKVKSKQTLKKAPTVITKVKKSKTNINKKAPQKIIAKDELPLPLPLPLPAITLTSLDQIPFKLNNGWLLIIDQLPLSKTRSCMLYHEKNGVFDGYRDNNIKVYLTLSQLVLKSDSNFDLTYPDTGVYIQKDGEDTVINSLTPTTQLNIAKSELLLINYLGRYSKELLIKSGYWPSWPITETRTMIFPFTNTDQMVTTLDICNSLLEIQ